MASRASRNAERRFRIASGRFFSEKGARRLSSCAAARRIVRSMAGNGLEASTDRRHAFGTLDRSLDLCFDFGEGYARTCFSRAGFKFGFKLCKRASCRVAHGGIIGIRRPIYQSEEEIEADLKSSTDCNLSAKNRAPASSPSKPGERRLRVRS